MEFIFLRKIKKQRAKMRIADGKTAKDSRTESQKTSLLKLLKDLKRSYPSASIRGHRDFANKACPSFDATKEYSSL